MYITYKFNTGKINKIVQKRAKTLKEENKIKTWSFITLSLSAFIQYIHTAG